MTETTWVEQLDRLLDQPREVRERWLATLSPAQAAALLADPAFRLAVDLLRHDIDDGSPT